MSSKHFINELIEEDIAKGGRYEGKTVHTRFPPEPNGWLHIGHAKAICIDFGLAEQYNGLCNLRMDDTNPSKEEEEFVEAIKEDIKWLGFDWEDRFFYASDYFEKMYELACELIKKGLAYVCELSAEETRLFRGTLTSPGKNSPYRNRSVEENLSLFAQMREGKFRDGEKTLRAKIDMSSGNINMRDPIIYRIQHATHIRSLDKWCIYPMYDFAHPIEDALEEITHSLCSIEFEDHRVLYDWVIDNLREFLPAKPRQIEFARLGINYTVMSKRKLRYLVENNLVDGWDDPRMPTLAGLRRRGYTPAAIRNFCSRIGVTKVPNTIDYAFLEHCLRDDLNLNTKRVMAVTRPIKLTISNYPEGKVEYFEAENNPENPSEGTRQIAFSRNLFIEEEDFMENPIRKYFRLFPGNEVRLKHAYIIKCLSCIKDEEGRVVEVIAEYDPLSRGGNASDGRKIKSTIHFVEASTAITAEVRLYDRLFSVENPDASDMDYLSCLNPSSLEIISDAKLEASLAQASLEDKFQFLRLGYFSLDPSSTKERLIFNRSVTLKDSFKIQSRTSLTEAKLMQKSRDKFYYMQKALSCAEKAAKIGEVPIGAVIVKDEKILATAYNKRESLNDVSLHAEIIALRKAGKKIGSWRLENCDIYVSLEPCFMCAAAIQQARIRKLYFAAKDAKQGAVVSVYRFYDEQALNHKVAYEEGIFASESKALIQDFFKKRRAENKALDKKLGGRSKRRDLAKRG